MNGMEKIVMFDSEYRTHGGVFSYSETADSFPINDDRVLLLATSA